MAGWLCYREMPAGQRERRLAAVQQHLTPSVAATRTGAGHGSSSGSSAVATTIVDVRAAPASADGRPASDWGGIQGLGQICVAVETADGRIGFGVGGGGQPGLDVIALALRPLLVGRDRADVEALWEAMYKHTLAYGRKGLTIMAISGVDLALWDLRAKAAGVSVAELLGASTAALSQPVPSYRTAPNDLAAAVAEGYTKVKLSIGGMDVVTQPDEIIATVQRAREELGGDVELMIDATMKWSDREAVLRLCERLARLDLAVAYLEEPLPSDDLEGYAWLTSRSPIPIAGGEHEQTAAGFAELMGARNRTLLCLR